MGWRLKRKVAEAARPLFHLPLPFRWQAINFLAHGLKAREAWRDKGFRWVRSRITGLDIPCDMASYSGRMTWLMGRWYELALQSIVMTLLPRGGTFIDIGSNIGNVMLAGAAAVGPEGKVITYEPNPQVADVQARSIRHNRLGNVTLNRCALGSEPGTAELFVPDHNHGESTLAGEVEGWTGKKVEIEIRDASELEAQDRIDLIKIDVEGFETEVLRGLRGTLAKHRPPIICELIDYQLERCGSSMLEFTSLLDEMDYVMLDISEEHVGPFKKRAVVKLLGADQQTSDINVLLVPADKRADYLAMRFKALGK